MNTVGVTAEVAATRAAGGHYAELTELFCTDRTCPLIVGNDLVYRDDNHLSAEYAGALAPVLAAEIENVLPGG